MYRRGIERILGIYDAVWHGGQENILIRVRIGRRAAPGQQPQVFYLRLHQAGRHGILLGLAGVQQAAVRGSVRYTDSQTQYRQYDHDFDDGIAGLAGAYSFC
jgi:hypothetical protein